MILVKHFCPLLELAPGVVDQHIHCRNTAPRTVSSSQHHPRTTHKEIVLHNQLQEKGERNYYITGMPFTQS